MHQIIDILDFFSRNPSTAIASVALLVAYKAMNVALAAVRSSKKTHKE